MPTIALRELCEQTSEVLRQVREQKAEYIITDQGRPVALLSPVQAEEVESVTVQEDQQSVADGLETYTRLIEQVQKKWPPGQRTQDLMDEIRR